MTFPSPLSARQRIGLSGAAIVMFGFGLLVYAVEREATRLSIVPATWSLSAGQASWWSLLLRDSLPSLAHAYAFTLLGCAWLARSWRQALAIGLCLWGIEATLEVLQHRPLHDWAGTPAWTRAIFVSSFDLQDLLAAAAGTLAAWGSFALALRRRHQNPIAT